MAAPFEEAAVGIKERVVLVQQNADGQTVEQHRLESGKRRRRRGLRIVTRGDAASAGACAATGGDAMAERSPRQAPPRRQ